MAITVMARMSSTMARVSRNTLAPAGTLEPSTASTPTAKAMSVAMGMPQPRPPSPPTLRSRKIPAGTTTPPTAARTGRQDRQAGPSGVAQLPGDQFALDLQADHEEEQGHEAVVDPVLEVLGDRQRAGSDGQLHAPQALVAGGEGAVGPPERDHRGGQEEQAAGRLGVQEVLDRVDHPTHGVGWAGIGHRVPSTAASDGEQGSRLAVGRRSTRR
jgi:hypothetical protein